MMQETDWAYFAGMLDGEGYIGIFRHYKRTMKHGSNRGYELETVMTVSNMNEDNLLQLRDVLKMGKIVQVRHDRPCGRLHVGSLRFNVSEQRIIIPHILPYAMQKKERLTIIKEFLDYRITHIYAQKSKEAIEERELLFYNLEKQFEAATFKAKPWLLLEPMRKRGRPYKPILPPASIRHLVPNTTTGNQTKGEP
jgi:hypothetical protein